MKHIVCFHLLNDYSGSPIVLKMALRGLLERGNRVDLVTTKGGVLDSLLDNSNLTIDEQNAWVMEQYLRVVNSAE